MKTADVDNDDNDDNDMNNCFEDKDVDDFDVQGPQLGEDRERNDGKAGQEEKR